MNKKEDPARLLLKRYSYQELCHNKLQLELISKGIENSSYALTAFINQIGRALEIAREEDSDEAIHPNSRF